MLTIDNLSVSYGTHTVLSQLDLSLERGGTYGTDGYNGAGKTTLLNAIYGIPAQRDCIRFDGAPLSRKDITRKGERFILDTKVYSFLGIGRFYMGLIPEIKIIDSPEFETYVRDYIKKSAQALIQED